MTQSRPTTLWLFFLLFVFCFSNCSSSQVHLEHISPEVHKGNSKEEVSLEPSTPLKEEIPLESPDASKTVERESNSTPEKIEHPIEQAVEKRSNALYWARRAGSTGTNRSYDLAIDTNDNIYIVGVFQGTTHFGGTTLTSSWSHTPESFVAKLDSHGNWLWAKHIKNEQKEGNKSYITVDAKGNILLAGAFRYNATFGRFALKGRGPADLFIAKLSASGKWLWAKGTGSESRDWITAVTTDTKGNIYTAGFVQGTTTFGSTTITATAETLFVAKLSTDGEWLWVRTGNTPKSSSRATHLALGKQNDLIVTGEFGGAITFGKDTLTHIGLSRDMFVAKLTTQGKWLWAKRGGNATGQAVAVHPQGGICVAGIFHAKSDFGKTTLSTDSFARSDSIFVAMLDAKGKWLWAQQTVKEIPSMWGSDLDGAAFDQQGHCTISGTMSHEQKFGTQKLGKYFGRSLAFVAKLDKQGKWLWARSTGLEYRSSTGEGMALDSKGNIVVAGYFEGTRSFDKTTLSANGREDLFVWKLQPKADSP